MNQRVHNLTKWRYLPEGESFRFAGDKRRMVILDVNCPAEVAFYVRMDKDDVLTDPERLTDEEAGRVPPGSLAYDFERSDDGAVAFLGLAKGRDRFEFGVEGPFELFCEGGGAYVFTVDGQETATRIVAPLIFTKIANRRARNPQLELMQYQMRVNQERMLVQLDEEVQRRISDLEVKYAERRSSGTPLTKPREAQGEAERILPEESDGNAWEDPEPPPRARKSKADKASQSEPSGET